MPKLSEQELTDRLAHAAVLAEPGSVYRHYKGGEYSVVSVAIIEENNQPGVIYRANYGQRLSFIRPLSSWSSLVDVEGKMVPRFEKIDANGV